MKTALVLAFTVLMILGCSDGDRNDHAIAPLPSVLPMTTIECRPCDPRRGPAIVVDFPITACDERDLALCWVRDDRCWYGCETTGEVGGKGCNR